ncbi:MAG: glycosyltransferase, partial [Lachnospiraceae bacterium]|nr:glycosyltransferase [Lachnospiraceae bacterium]
DENHIKFIKEFYPNVKNTFFITQGGRKSENLISLAERPIDVIYMGSQTAFHGFPAISFLSDNGSDLYSYCVNFLFSDNSKTAHEAIKKYLSEKNIELSDSDFFELNHDCADSITNYVRREYKFLGMHALDQAGIHVDVYGGDSWVDSENSYSPNIKLHERVDIEELLKKASQSKISLCFVPWFKKGCSEKNFDSMLNGALCISDRSEYLDEHYQDGKNIIYFDLNNPAQMAADVKWLLEHIDAAEQIAQKGYETALKYDSADIMYEKIYNLMNQIK